MEKVLIVDDHEIVRLGLKLLLGDFYPGSIVMEAQNGEFAIDMLKKNAFDLVLLDVQMPQSNSFEILNFIVSRQPLAKVLIYSMGSEALFGKSFIKAGAHGYLSKDAPMKEVQKAIASVMNGKQYMSEDLLATLVKDVANGTPKNPFFKLSPRETEITTFLLQGFSLSEISTRVNLQTSTVSTYKARIFEKLDVSNVIQLKEIAILYHF